MRQVDTALKTDGSLPARILDAQHDCGDVDPAFALAFLTNSQIESAYRPLASPPILVFFIFIILSTPKVEPLDQWSLWCCRQRRYLCAALYFGVAAYRPWHSGRMHPIQRKPECDNAFGGWNRSGRRGWTDS